MKKKVEIIETRVNKIAIGIFLLIMPILSCPKQLLASDSSKRIEVQQEKKKISLNIKDRTLVHILSEIKKQTGLAYGFQDSKNSDSDEKFSIRVQNVSVDSALTVLFKNTTYKYQIVGDLILVSVKKQGQQAEQQQVQISGRVTDEKGNPIPGATVLIHGTTRGVATDLDGRYLILAKPDDVLKVSFIGYKSETVPIKGKIKQNITLNPTAENLEEVTVVAFGEQKKESVVASITTVDAKTLKSSSSDLTTQFAGKIPGMIAWQTGGIPGALTEEEMNTKFYIRGITSFQTGANIDPLILIDGVESSKLDLSRIAPEDIETFSVLKDASATAMYGARGANGVILITTKKGEEGSVYTSVRYEMIASMPTKEIEVVEPVTYMRMYNEALLARNPNAIPQYSVERIDRTGSPNYPSWVYPANDWYKILFKNNSINHHMGVNVRGGSKVMQYYASLNWNRDEGMLKTDRLNQFDCNIKNNTFTFRTNLNIDLAAGIRLLINSAASLDKYHGPLTDVKQAYSLAFNASPVDFAPTYPADSQYNWPHIRFGTSVGEKVNPYEAIQSGYRERSRYSATVRAEYIHNLSALLKGLELRASMSMNREGYYDMPYSTVPARYALEDGGYDFETGEHKLTAKNPLKVRRTLRLEGISESQATRIAYEVRGLHSAAWGEHQTSLTGVLSAQDGTSSSAGSVLDAIPKRNISFSMRGTYGFKDRYFAEASFGYNGSERFDEGHRWGFFPAFGVAWIATKENFFAAHTAQWLSFLKFRLSWGQVGNDGIIKEPRFVHLSTIGTQGVMDPRPTMKTTARYVIASYGNRKVKWEVAEQANLGIEMKLFDGIFEMNADIYQEIRHDILDYRRTVPASMGLEYYQLANVGKARSRGVDLSGKIQHAFSNDFWMILNGTFTYSKAIFQEIEEATDKPEWQLKRGHELSQKVGYIAEGLFADQAEIDNAPVQGGDLKPGDIRYRDLNGDGVIDVSDATHIGFPTTPRAIYGFSGFFNYKNVEFNFAFQGSGKRGFFIDPMLINPFVSDKAMLKAIHDDHWSESNMKDRPFWPRLSTQPIGIHNPQEDKLAGVEERRSTYFMRECKFLRCTSIELAYNLPKRVKDRLKMKDIKLYARVNNPFIISDFDIWDVELGDKGFNYPIQRTYSVGLNINF